MNIFITGATGFLGGEILVYLAKRKEVDKIYCLVRAKTGDDADRRIRKVFALHNDAFDPGRITAVPGDLVDPNLPEALTKHPGLSQVNIIIHAAADTSFSRIYDLLVEEINIHGLKKILGWAQTLPDLQLFEYIGTATICGTNITNRLIYESESPNLATKHLVKYTQTKLMGELALSDYLPREKLLIARPSIVMGDSREVVSRSSVILWALAVSNLVRLVPTYPDVSLDIIPVDYAAKAISDLLFVKRNHNVYHISSGTASRTSPRQLGNAITPYFPGKPDLTFVDPAMISQMKFWSKGILSHDSELNKYKDHLEYWKSSLGDPLALRILFAGWEPYLHFINLGHVFDNIRLLQDLAIEPPPPAHIYVKKCIPFLRDIDVFEGALDP
jgi:thioester reductase-like protein